MQILSAYLTVIIIWSTTPLAIQWSGNEVGFAFGVASRMLIGLIALLIISRLWRIPLPWNRHSRLVYLAGGIPLFLAMSLVYWAAQYIPSGWIAVIFGLTPFITSLFARIILGDKSFTLAKTSGMLLGLFGLMIVFIESIDIRQQAWLGVAGICLSAIAHSLSSVLIKKLNPVIHPVSITTGSLLVATPLFVASAMYAGLPEHIPMQSMLAIIYLAIMGSALGFPLYFYCLKQLHAQRVALITLITPVMALILGSGLNNEIISPRIWYGTMCIVMGLAIYEYGQYLPLKKHWLRWLRYPL
jgi:drug/metabolite transporter (DMT)-like permease